MDDLLLGYKTKASDPFFNLADLNIPADHRSMLKWAKYFYATEPLVADIVYKKAEYPITALQVKTPNSDVKEKYLEVFKAMELRERLVDIGINYYVFGVVYASIYSPFKRTFTCHICKSVVEPVGNTTVLDKEERANWEIRSKKLYIHCEHCGTKQPADISEDTIPTSDDFRIHLWDPLHMVDEYNPLSEKHAFVYNVPKSIIQNIKTQARFLKEVPKIFLKVALEDKSAVRFNEDKIIFLRRPCYADDENGLGVPPIFHVAKTLYYMGLLRKANGYIAADHLKPYRYLTPTMMQGTPYTPQTPAFPHLGNLASQLKDQIQKWRNDPNEIAFFPSPLQQNALGGDGRPLMVHQELKMVEDEVISGLQVPQEFVRGGLSWSGSSVSLRMLENHFINYRGFLMRLVEKVARRIEEIKDLPRVKVSLQEFKMADDTERKRLYMELNAARKLSDETMMEEFGVDPDIESSKMLKDARRRAQVAAEESIRMRLAEIRATATLQQEAIPSSIDITNQEVPGFLMEALMEASHPEDILNTPSMRGFVTWLQSLKKKEFEEALAGIQAQFPLVYSLLVGIIPVPAETPVAMQPVEGAKEQGPSKGGKPLPEQRPPQRRTGQTI